MTLDAHRIALQGLGIGLTAISIAMQGLLGIDEPTPPVVDTARGTGRVYYEWVDRTPRQIKRRRAEEALLLGKLYLL